MDQRAHAPAGPIRHSWSICRRLGFEGAVFIGYSTLQKALLHDNMSEATSAQGYLWLMWSARWSWSIMWLALA